jgi:hypothetical protein
MLLPPTLPCTTRPHRLSYGIITHGPKSFLLRADFGILAV